MGGTGNQTHSFFLSPSYGKCFRSSKFLPMRIPQLSWLFLIPIFIISVSGQCLPEQKSLLLQLKNNLTFNSSISTKLKNWNQTLDCCQWIGVTCDRNGYVAGLDLNSESISNGIGYSSTLFSLRYLETLNLANNSFNSTAIPSSIGKLTNLVYLNLSNAGFSGQIPIELSFLTRLVTLDLSTLFFPPIHSLQIQNPNLSTLFGNLRGVKELHLDGVNISANGYEWGQAISSSMPNLRVLSLSNCYLSGPIDVSLQNLQNLSEIRLGSNNLSSLVPDFFVNFPNLTVLRLSSSNLYGTFPQNIFQLVQTLETLDLTSNPLLNGSLHDFPENGSLRNLVLTDTSFSGNLPQSIGNLMELRSIEIPRCYFSGPIPKSLANLSQLVYLDFSSNNFSGPIPWFQESKNLTYIDLSHNTLTGVVPSTHFEGLLNLVYIDLASNSFNGSIPSSLFSLPSLQKILLSNNKFGGPITGFSNELSPLDTLDLSSNELEGPIPSHFFDFLRLNILSLSFNNFSGTIQLNRIQKLKNLTRLELSYNSLTVDVSVNISSLSSFPQLTVLSLASCNLQKFPALMNQSRITHLDLSDNQIFGVIPNWIWNVGDGKLVFLNLSCNSLVSLQREYVIPRLVVLDLHSNQLCGEIPIPPESAVYVDYSRNNFTSPIPAEIGNGIASAAFFSLSDNMLSGPIPPSICNGSYLRVLDLSDNRFSGAIPHCLIDSGSAFLGVLDLQNNNLTGNIAGTFPEGCALRTLDLSGNNLEGQVPKSLANCADAKVLNLGNNNINGFFPCFLTNLSSLRVLVLRSNKFHGNINCQGLYNTIWPKLQIIDLALNNFSGILPPQFFLQMKAMMGNAKTDLNHLRYEFLNLNKFYYQDSVTVINKGLEMKLVKILTLFTAVDFSGNSFEGQIPDTIGDLSSLHLLNLSRNTLSGQIPSKLGNLTQLESLDLSVNKLNGSIPETLTGLTFLAVLNLSHNQLVGVIPRGHQFETFSNDSFLGNAGLCGLPLSNSCKETEPPPVPSTKRRVKDSGSAPKIKFDWQLCTGLGFGMGAGFIVGPLVFWKQGSRWCDKQIEKVVWMIGPTVGLIFSCCGGVKVDPESKTEEEPETEDTDEEDGEDMEENAFPGGIVCFVPNLIFIGRKPYTTRIVVVMNHHHFLLPRLLPLLVHRDNTEFSNC